MSGPDGTPILELEELQIGVREAAGGVRSLVDAVSLSIQSGERVALVGESGCGKSLTALACLGLIPPPLVLTAGRVVVNGRDLASASSSDLQQLRGGTVGLVFQEPVGALNPVYSVGFQLLETIRSHGSKSRHQARVERDQLLERVGLGPVRELARAYPHQLSGGQLQRAMLAIALAGHPQLLIADEPTTALDLTTQARILGLIRTLSEEEGLALLLITHDLAVVATLVDRVIVMYAGEVIERAPAPDLLTQPLHPYTRELLAAISRSPRGPGDSGPLPSSAETVTKTESHPNGCRFAARCVLVQPSCRGHHPSLLQARAQHMVRCPVVLTGKER